MEYIIKLDVLIKTANYAKRFPKEFMEVNDFFSEVILMHHLEIRTGKDCVDGVGEVDFAKVKNSIIV